MPRPVKFAGKLFAFSLLPLLVAMPLLAVSFGAPAVVQDDRDAVERDQANVMDAHVDAHATVASYSMD